jgi:hypothetical protein
MRSVLSEKDATTLVAVMVPRVSIVLDVVKKLL